MRYQRNSKDYMSKRLTWSDTSSNSSRPANNFESCETVSIAESAQRSLVLSLAQHLNHEFTLIDANGPTVAAVCDRRPKSLLPVRNPWRPCNPWLQFPYPEICVYSCLFVVTRASLAIDALKISRCKRCSRKVWSIVKPLAMLSHLFCRQTTEEKL